MKVNDPFPRDSGPKVRYRVCLSRVLHLNEAAHYEAGEIVLLSPERVAKMGLKHLVEPADVEAVAGVGNSETRAVRSALQRPFRVKTTG